MTEAAVPGQPTAPAAGAGRPRLGVPRKDLVSGGLLVVAALLAVGGSFAWLDRAVDRVDNGPAPGPGRVDEVAVTGPWHYVVSGGDGRVLFQIDQYFGVALVVGGALALAVGLLLVTGQARWRGALRPAGSVAAALLFGAVLTTVMVVLGDQQFDTLVRSLHVTTPQLGFWLLAAAGVLALVAAPIQLAGVSRDGAPGPEAEAETPAYGLSVIALPPGEWEDPRRHRPDTR